MDEPSPITEAIRLFKSGKCEESARVLHDFLSSQSQSVEALLWLARVTPNDREAIAAAELALSLQPENETARRAVAAVQSRDPKRDPASNQVETLRITGMTHSQARAVNWPFNGLNRPIGVLLDEGSLALKDLAWATQNARNTLIQQAARTLLLNSLLGEEQKESPRPLMVMEGTDYSGHMQRRSLALEGLLLGAGGAALVMVFLLLGLSFVLVLRGQTLITLVLQLIALLFLLVAGIGTNLGTKYSEEGEQYRAGREGEIKVIDTLRASLNSPWVLIHNLEWADRAWGDIDLVLLGTGGVWALEVKSFRTPTRSIGDRWEYRGRGGWHRIPRDPGRQSTNNAIRVKEYLAAHGATVKWVQAVVVWAGEDALLTIQDPAVPVWRLSELLERVEECWREQRLTADQVEKGVNVLKQVIDQKKAQLAAERAKERKRASL